MSKFTAAVKKAKTLYKTGKFKTFADAVKAAYKKVGTAAAPVKKKAARKAKPVKAKKRVGATLLIEKGESRRTKPKRVITITRKKNGTYKKIGTIKKGMGNLPPFSDPSAAREIQLYYENDSQTYYSSRRPIEENLYKKWKKGTFKTELAAKLIRYGIEFAMKRYNTEHGSRGDKWFDLLSVNDRKTLSMEIAQYMKQSLDQGSLDYVFEK